MTYNKKLTLLEGFSTFVLVLLISAIAFIISTLIILFGWNIGVVALVAACGGTVSKIGFWTAFFVGFAINVLRVIFKVSA